MGRQQKANAARLPWCLCNKFLSFQLHKHLVDGRRRNSKESLHVSLCGRLAIDLGVIVNKSQILSLFLGVTSAAFGDRFFS